MPKSEKAQLDGTPVKRIFWSIISDYETVTALCELVDNAIDNWWPRHSAKTLTVKVELDVERQLIVLEDDAGGIAEQNLVDLIAPGASHNNPNGSTIGVFGVGSKRAAVALAESITIRTRRGSEPTYQIDITKDWVESDSWQIPYYECDSIPAHSTRIDMSLLRRPLTNADTNHLISHFGAVYAKFLSEKRFKLLVNNTPVSAVGFDKWAFPEDHPPQRLLFDVDVPAKGSVVARITSGLIYDRDPEAENYGIYVYCNGRLIAAHLRSREVGYGSGAGAGVPHPDASMARAIVELEGPAILMPWTSNKTSVNYTHPVFLGVQVNLITLIGHYASLSRRLKDRWASEVVGRRTGSIVEIQGPAAASSRLHLPALPRVNKRPGEQLVARNRKQIEKAPWGLGLVEAIAATDVVIRQRFETRNRIALILLDSNFEIAIKEFIVHRSDLFPNDQYNDKHLAHIFRDRRLAVAAVVEKVDLPQSLVDRAAHFYLVRNKLIHERATVGIADSEVRNYRQVLQQTLQILFGLNVGPA